MALGTFGPRSRAKWAVLVLALVIMVGAGLVLARRFTGGPTEPSAALKPMGAGLYVDSSTLPVAQGSTIDHAFINVGWNILEPERGSYDWTPIDDVLRANPTTKFRLRLEAGVLAPRWLDAVSGRCVQLDHRKTGATGCVPRFWTTEYLSRYAAFISAAGTRYDAQPQVLDVVNGACMTFTAEPFILGGKTAAEALYRAGLTLQRHKDCLTRSTAMIDRAFPHTRISLATFDGWQVPSDPGGETDWPMERALLQQLRKAYGDKLVLQNNGLADQTCTASDGDQNLYCYLRSIPPPKGFQQGCGKKVLHCDQASVVEHALALGGCFVEHANWRSLGPGEVTYDKKLKQNPGCESV